jgi:hypothetical protein
MSSITHDANDEIRFNSLFQKGRGLAERQP